MSSIVNDAASGGTDLKVVFKATRVKEFRGTFSP